MFYAITNKSTFTNNSLKIYNLYQTRPEVSEGGLAISNLIQGVAREEADRHTQIEVSMDLPL